jgi:hypothetical protein
MRDKDLCRVLEAIYRLFIAVATRENLSSEQVTEDFNILKREIQAMGGGVE